MSTYPDAFFTASWDVAPESRTRYLVMKYHKMKWLVAALSGRASEACCRVITLKV